jgi:hypothetical protein
MDMRFTTRHVLILATIVAIGACQSTAPTASPSPAPAASASPLPGPSIDANADPALAASFPKTIDGQPVTNVQTFHFLDILLTTGAPSTVIDQFNRFASAAGINPRSVNLGTAEVTVGGKAELLQALRARGTDASHFIQPLVAVAQVRNVGARATPRSLTVSASTVGGKNVQVATSPDLTQYYYPTGDTVFILNNVDAATAATILAALP